MVNSYVSQVRIISPLPPFRADVREIAHGLIIHTIQFTLSFLLYASNLTSGLEQYFSTPLILAPSLWAFYKVATMRIGSHVRHSITVNFGTDT